MSLRRRRYDGPGSMVEPGIDATDEHWEHVARATQLKREQVAPGSLVVRVGWVQKPLGVRRC